VQNYRAKSEVSSWREAQDPIDRLRRRLTEGGDLDEPGYAALERQADEAVADAIGFAERSPWPDTGTVDRSWPTPQVIGLSQ
jgi:TPP-dependent pyruvate/acetoin dehydrogenase alpha subunit